MMNTTKVNFTGNPLAKRLVRIVTGIILNHQVEQAKTASTSYPPLDYGDLQCAPPFGRTFVNPLMVATAKNTKQINHLLVFSLLEINKIQLSQIAIFLFSCIENIFLKMMFVQC
jgi:hypothetical protein